MAFQRPTGKRMAHSRSAPRSGSLPGRHRIRREQGAWLAQPQSLQRNQLRRGEVDMI